MGERMGKYVGYGIAIGTALGVAAGGLYVWDGIRTAMENFDVLNLGGMERPFGEIGSNLRTYAGYMLAGGAGGGTVGFIGGLVTGAIDDVVSGNAVVKDKSRKISFPELRRQFDALSRDRNRV
jgi:hypothetical protein